MPLRTLLGPVALLSLCLGCSDATEGPIGAAGSGANVAGSGGIGVVPTAGGAGASTTTGGAAGSAPASGGVTTGGGAGSSPGGSAAGGANGGGGSASGGSGDQDPAPPRPINVQAGDTYQGNYNGQPLSVNKSKPIMGKLVLLLGGICTGTGACGFESFVKQRPRTSASTCSSA